MRKGGVSTKGVMWRKGGVTRTGGAWVVTGVLRIGRRRGVGGGADDARSDRRAHVRERPRGPARRVGEQDPSGTGSLSPWRRRTAPRRRCRTATSRPTA